MDKSSTNSQARGRPPSIDVAEAVYRTAIKLVSEGSLAGISRSEIAAHAGVSRQTLYNRWESVGDIVLEALLERGEREIGSRSFSSEIDRRPALRHYLTGLADALNEWAAPGLRAVAAMAQQDEAFAHRFRERLVAPRRRRLGEVVSAACESTGQNPAVMTELIVASMWYRLLVSGESLDAAWVDAMMSLLRP